MLTFKQFLSESWTKNEYGDPCHHKEVHGANVTVWAAPNMDYHFSHAEGHYHVGFTTNGRELSSDIETHGAAGHQILKHVAGTLHSFVKEHKPKSITFSANERKKNKAYHAFASILAKHLGGVHHTWPNTSDPSEHTIHFNHGKKS